MHKAKIKMGERQVYFSVSNDMKKIGEKITHIPKNNETHVIFNVHGAESTSKIIKLVNI